MEAPYNTINCAWSGDSVLNIGKDSIPDELHLLTGQSDGNFPRVSQRSDELHICRDKSSTPEPQVNTIRKITIAEILCRVVWTSHSVGTRFFHDCLIIIRVELSANSSFVGITRYFSSQH